MLIQVTGHAYEYTVSPTWLVAKVSLDELASASRGYIQGLVAAMCSGTAEPSATCYAILDNKMSLILFIVEVWCQSACRFILKTRQDLIADGAFSVADFEFYYSRQYVADHTSAVRWSVLDPKLREMFTLVDLTAREYKKCLALYDAVPVEESKISEYDEIFNNQVLPTYRALSYNLPLGWKFLPLFYDAAQAPGVSLMNMNFDHPGGLDRFPVLITDIVYFIGSKLNDLCSTIVSDHADISTIAGATSNQLVSRNAMFAEYRAARWLLYSQFAAAVESILELPESSTFDISEPSTGTKSASTSYGHSASTDVHRTTSTDGQQRWTNFRVAIVVANVHRTQHLTQRGDRWQCGYILSKKK